MFENQDISPRKKYSVALPVCVMSFLRAIYVSYEQFVHVSCQIIQSCSSNTGIMALSSMYVLNDITFYLHL